MSCLGRSKAPHALKVLVVWESCRAGSEAAATPAQAQRSAVWAWARDPDTLDLFLALWLVFSKLKSSHSFWTLYFSICKRGRECWSEEHLYICALWVLSGRSCFSNLGLSFGILSRFLARDWLAAAGREHHVCLTWILPWGLTICVLFPAAPSTLSLPDEWELTE